MPKIVIDPGHGGLNAYGVEDPGAVAFGRREMDDAMRLAELVAADAKAEGLTVTLTRAKGQVAASVPGVNARAAMANTAEADLFVSLHRNAFTSPTAKGVEVLVQNEPSAAEERFAGLLMDRLADVGISQNRGVKRCTASNNFAVLRLTDMPAAMVELGFITNEEDNLMFDANITAYAAAIVDAILDMLGLQRKATEPPTADTAELTAEIARLEDEIRMREQQTAEMQDSLSRLNADLDNKDAEIATREQQTRAAEAKTAQLKAKAAQMQMLAAEMLQL